MKKPDIFDPSKRYVFSNWSNEDFEFKYSNPDFQFVPPPDDEYTQKEVKRMYNAAFAKDGFKTVKVKAGGIIEIQEWLAFLMMKHFVDREFIKAVEGKYGSLSITVNDGKKNEKAEGEVLQMNSPGARDHLEDKTIRLISSNEESPVIAALREQIRREEIAKLKKLGEIELEALEVKTNIEQSADVPEAPRRRGRPRKEFAEANIE